MFEYYLWVKKIGVEIIPLQKDVGQKIKTLNKQLLK